MTGQGTASCPLCGQEVEVSSRGNLRDHPPAGRGWSVLCPASGRTYSVAYRMLTNRKAGRHIKRNEDGSWLA